MTQLIALIFAVVALPCIALVWLVFRAIEDWTKSWGKL